MTDLTDEQRREIDRIRKLPWTAQFHKTLDNPTVPGGKVDMYVLLDEDTGEYMVALSTPHGEIGRAVADYVAMCCADPWFVRVDETGNTTVKLAVAFNRAAKPFLDKDDAIDARDVFAAAMTMIEAYVGELPQRSRAELIDNAMARISALRNRP